MTFLTPWSALAAAAIAIPLLLALYFLKLRRRFVRIPSTLLWQSKFEDLQVNVPFQRLRFSALLLLQLLILVLLLLALAQPLADANADPASRVVLLIDRSASMNAVDDPETGETRLDRAKQAARDIVEQVDARSTPTEVMVLSFAASARVVSGFESEADALGAAIDAIEPSDGRADLSHALRLAEAFARRQGEEDTAPVDVILLSDGGVEPPEDASGYALQAGDFRFVQTGPERGAPVDNIGIVSFSARRDFERPGTVLVFTRLINAGARPVDIVLTLRADNEVAGIERMTVPPATAAAAGEASATFEMELPAGAVLTLEHNHADQLADDDIAVVYLPPPARPRIALVYAGSAPDPFLLEVLESSEPELLEPVDLERFLGMDEYGIDTADRYDVIVFDRVQGHRLPGVPTLTFGGVPSALELTTEPTDEGRRLLSWERQHPLLRHVNLDGIVYSGFSGFRLPAGSDTLAIGRDGPVLAMVRARGAPHVLVGFELSRSNWPVDVSFIVFLHNTLDYLTAAQSGQTAVVHQPGEAIAVKTRPDARELRVSGPRVAEVPVSGAGTATLPVLEAVGLYRVDGAMPPQDVIAVSMLSDTESDLRPRDKLTVNARAVEAGSARDAAPMELWPWLVALAGVLMVLEWLIYCWRMKG